MDLKPSGLEIQALQVQIHGKPLVREVSLTARPGQITCLVGPNGAGKSSLVKAVAGILPSKGTVQLHGQEVSKMTPRDRALAIGYVPQRSGIALPFTAAEVVAHGLYAEAGDGWNAPAGQRARALEILKELDMAAFAERIFPTLSGGEQQLVLLARALVGRPKLLLLDEPASALDIRHRLDLDARLRHLADQGLTILVILHDLTQVLEIADVVTLLSEGRVVASGPAKDVLLGPSCADVFGVEIQPHKGPGIRRVPGKTP